MINIARWKIILTAIVCAFALLYSMPNVMGEGARNFVTEKLPNFVPHKTVMKIRSDIAV